MQAVEIRVEGQIDKSWSDWLGGLVIEHITAKETLLTGTVPDQTALYGLLTKLRDMGLPLISVMYGHRKLTADN
jgi:hypothetical protein